MTAVSLHDKSVIESFLRRNAHLHIYQLGDLDDFFWEYTTWQGLRGDGGEIDAVTLLYTGMDPPTLLALADEGDRRIDRLLEATLHLLPVRFYAHLTPGVEPVLDRRYHLDPHGAHFKMALRHVDALDGVDSANVVPLTTDDEAEILALYADAYPGNWFDSRMLLTHQYFGVREAGRLVTVAGIHVYSPRYSVAALGNIVTHPEYRGRGLARAATARLCRSLLESVDAIGLNVACDNVAAIRCYERLGFEINATYGEYMIEVATRDRRPGAPVAGS